ncbi:sigma-70 family RNA polymerase sigma factor [Erythrobacter sp.]|uniref:sigma-70 family RNA polymerase sigma factor n=1 Tax=Erythrobacter sp. TaxID=1042 RepID=UPI001B1421E1|nr:sigma-70 family RNA polymerase sigma factor [Erythrobacter sp.]MBO6525548.1 sigma-70 family RNA polymerase sigma factor [Erythrobacter sp.]MBO6529779.1 sigma-70 family RNA polymerase sigma factor [Erythrobacter sp.]
MQGKNATGLHAELIEVLTPLRRYCYSLTGNPYDADDLLQDTLERLLERGAPSDADIRKWAFRICRNRWIDEMRSRNVRTAQDIDELPDAAIFDGEAAVEGHIELSQAEEAIASLALEFREVLMLVAVEGMKYKEAAELIGIPVGTVMSRLARARHQLTEYGSSDGDDGVQGESANVVPIKRGGK